MKSILVAILLTAVAATPLTALAQQSLSGTWTIAASQEVDEVQLDLRMPNSSGGYRDENSNIVSLADLHLTRTQLDSTAGGRATFAMHRDAGTINFQGWLQKGGGGGNFTFAADPNYQSQLQHRGYGVNEAQKLLTGALIDLSLAYIDDINRQGFGRLEFEKLVTFRALHVEDAYIKQMRSRFADVTAENIVSLRALNVNDAYLSELHSIGLSPATANEAVELKALHVDAAYVREMASAGYPHLAPHDLVELRAMGIDANYVKRVQAHGFHNLTVQKLVETKALGVI